MTAAKRVQIDERFLFVYQMGWVCLSASWVCFPTCFCSSSGLVSVANDSDGSSDVADHASAVGVVV